jgi:hypothetical protein
VAPEKRVGRAGYVGAAAGIALGSSGPGIRSGKIFPRFFSRIISAYIPVTPNQKGTRLAFTMTASPPGKSPLLRLVLFIICLAITGSIIAGVHYFAIDLPQQQNMQAPTNAGSFCSYAVAQNIYCSCLDNAYGQEGFTICMEGGQQAFSCTFDPMQFTGMTCS